MRGTNTSGACLRLLPALLLCGLVLGCGSAPASPTPPAPPAGPVTPEPPVFSLAGNWTGTVESANFPAHPVTLVVVQAASCVDGEWKDATGDWKGAISGLATADSFSGQVSYERTADGGGKCQAAATISGPIGGDTFRWKAGPLTAVGTCNGDLPQSLVLSFQRQP